MASANSITEVLVIGATGGCGKGAFNACKKLGLNVKAFARSKEKAERELGASTRVCLGDLGDQQSLEKAMANVSHIIVAIGPFKGDDGKPEIVEFGGMQNIVAAAKKQGGSIKKIVNITSYGMEEPNWFMAGFLNNIGRDTMGWKLKAEMVLRESGIPYVGVRPSGLKDKDHDTPPIVKQTTPYEWGMAQVSREVVGEVCANALLHAPDCVTVAVKEDKAAKGKGLAGFDWAGTFGQCQRDKPITVTFEDHMVGKASFQRKLCLCKASCCAVVLLLVFWMASALMRSSQSTGNIPDGAQSNASFLELVAVQPSDIDPTTNFSPNVIKYQETGALAESLAFLFMMVAISICWIECCRGRKFF